MLRSATSLQRRSSSACGPWARSNSVLVGAMKEAYTPLRELPVTWPPARRESGGALTIDVSKQKVPEPPEPSPPSARRPLDDRVTDLKLVLAAISDAGAADRRRVEAALEGRRPW